MDAANLLSEQSVTGWLLILSSMLFLPSGLLYTARAIWRRPWAQSGRYLFLERGLVMSAVLAATLGFMLLAQLLKNRGDVILSTLAMTIFLMSAVLSLTAESLELGRQEGLYPTIVVSVILAFTGQALFGLSILRTGYLPVWVGWTAVIWNLGWLVILPIARRQEMYYPWLHYVAPLVIGITLLGSA